MSREKFVLEGWTYYQEERRCGKPSCKTCQEVGAHFGYWWRRKKGSKREYIGRELPEEVNQLRTRLEATTATIESHISMLFNDIQLLQKLRNRQPLIKEEKFRLAELGYKYCLVDEPAHNQSLYEIINQDQMEL